MKKLLTYIAFQILLFFGYSQNKAIGSWTDHLSYNKGTAIDTDGQNVFCGTTSGMFIYNNKDNSIERKNKINGLSEISIQSLKYNNYNKKLIIIYNNGGVDIINTINNKVYNIPFIKNSTSITDKTVNKITLYKEIAYLSLNFGIIAINTDKNEIIDTYKFNENGIIIFSTVRKDKIIYAATNTGIYKGDLTTNLLNFNNWSKINSTVNKRIENIFKVNNDIYFTIRDENNNIDSIYKLTDNFNVLIEQKFEAKDYQNIDVKENEVILFYDNNKIDIYDSTLTKKHHFQIYGTNLVSTTKTNKHLYVINNHTPVLEYDIDGSFNKSIKPSGPNNDEIFNITAKDGIIWTISGAYDFSLNNAFKYININLYENGRWKTYTNYNTSSLANVYDPVSIKTHPNNSKHIYVCTWGSGLFELINEPPFIKYDETNSTIKERQAFANWRGVSDVSFDAEGNLWVVNTHVPQALSVRTTDNNWYSFDFSTSPSIVHEDRMTELIISNKGYKWVAMPLNNTILVFDDNGTIQNKNDDRHIILTQETGKGNLPGSRGITMEIDKNGQIWVGTSDGVVVHYNPDNVFDENSRDFEEIIINDGNNNEVVLSGTVINDIEIDGANRKWIATEGSGVFLFSSDLKKEIFHFTKDNSPLISNSIKTIAFDETTGDVYFGTSSGLISYKSEVISAYENFNEIIVYPNPVRPNYNGPIAIKGLMDNTTVKITDINGTLVNEIITEGGQAIWYGTNFNNEKVSSGVYLIFNSAEDEFGNLNTKIGKVLFLK